MSNDDGKAAEISSRRLSAAERQDSILDSAVELFAQAPYAQVWISQISAAAGVSDPLVHKYFDSKAGVYEAALQRETTRLEERRAEAVTALGTGRSARDVVKAMLQVEIRHAQAGQWWSSPLSSPPEEPASAAVIRQSAREELVRQIQDQLLADGSRRQDYALWGFLGFVAGELRRWVDLGLPADDYWPIVETGIDALGGALGDWGR